MLSDAAIPVIVTGLVTITTVVVGFLTTWVKLKYGVDKAEEAATKAAQVEEKIDENTVISTAAKNAAMAAEKQTNGAMSKYQLEMVDVVSRVTALEAGFETLKLSMETVTKNVDSTRHEMRGHMQTMSNKLNTMPIELNAVIESAVGKAIALSKDVK